MPINSAAKAARTTRRLRDKGIEFTIKTQAQAGGYDPIEGEYNEGIPAASITAVGLMFPPTENDVATLAAPAAQADKERQLIYSMPTKSDVTPAPLPIQGDLVTFAGDVWTVEKAQALAPNGINLLWSILVNK